MLENKVSNNNNYKMSENAAFKFQKHLPRSVTPINYYQMSTDHANHSWFVDP